MKYKEKFLANLETEISEFRERTLSCSPKEIYEDCSRIHFYEFMSDYLVWEDFKPKEYKAFLQSDKNFIANLWRRSMKWEDFNIGSIADASLLVDEYVADCEANPIPHCM